MCYHVATPSKAQLKQQFPKKEIVYREDEIFHVTGFVRPFLPVELNEEPEQIQPARWKLLPFWVKNEVQANNYANTLNADADTIFEKASYKNYIKKYRGLLYVNGFYEPHQNKDVKETDNYYIYMPNKEIFTLGIVYAPWTDVESGKQYSTFSIITTEANPMMEEIHNVKKRMPLVVPADKRKEWLEASDPAEIKQLMLPYDGELGAHKVYRVTAARGEDTNKPEIQEEVE